MTRDELRLELLSLTYSHGRDAAEAVERAKVLELYVCESIIKELEDDEDVVIFPQTENLPKLESSGKKKKNR
jgi:hypothetical protein